MTRVAVNVEGRRLSLSNLDKVLYPETGFTKRDVIDYYRQVAPLMLPHITGRPTTLRRFPDGVTGQWFYEKDVSRHAPDWLRTARLANSRDDDNGSNDYPVLDDLASLVWAANLAALELHVPQWTVTPDCERATPDRLVFDLDPGAPATIVECCRVAEALREMLTADGLTPVPKTSGSKGMQLYCPVRTEMPDDTSRYAKAVAQRLATEQPSLVVATMTRSARTGKVFIDWSQNNPSKTTVAPYSLRAKEAPTVSTPVTWDEVGGCTTASELRFETNDVLERIAAEGDLFAGVLGEGAPVPA
ncbi:non-homologous end-joining DNA ligase [Haloechinothrix halophila]|uniref:non-homologous end-joining DNA ligase n=1 Tax=Haloechinothrix halophila TaxID=1069073 RepID=UPI0005503D53|nr:non-homologous end-joining DNA ligase [Haloechinothrix halophila]